MPLERRGRSSSRPPVSASLTAGRRDAPAEPELPMLHRLAVVYLMLPVVVWLVGWFEWWFGLPAAALLVGALRRPLSGRWRLRAPTPAEAAVLAVAALWVLATAAGGVFDPRNPDFFDYRVTLLDLGRHPWPTYLPDPLAAWRPAPAEGPPATPPLLRYYLGWHMVPGLAAHWLGPAALSWAVRPVDLGRGRPRRAAVHPRAAGAGAGHRPRRSRLLQRGDLRRLCWQSRDGSGSTGCHRKSGLVRLPDLRAGVPADDGPQPPP